MIEIRCVVFHGVGWGLTEQEHKGSFGGDASAVYIDGMQIIQVHFQDDQIVHGRPELSNMYEQQEPQTTKLPTSRGKIRGK